MPIYPFLFLFTGDIIFEKYFSFNLKRQKEPSFPVDSPMGSTGMKVMVFYLALSTIIGSF